MPVPVVYAPRGGKGKGGRGGGGGEDGGGHRSVKLSKNQRRKAKKEGAGGCWCLSRHAQVVW